MDLWNSEAMFGLGLDPVYGVYMYKLWQSEHELKFNSGQ